MSSNQITIRVETAEPAGEVYERTSVIKHVQQTGLEILSFVSANTAQRCSQQLSTWIGWFECYDCVWGRGVRIASFRLNRFVELSIPMPHFPCSHVERRRESRTMHICSTKTVNTGPCLHNTETGPTTPVSILVLMIQIMYPPSRPYIIIVLSTAKRLFDLSLKDLAKTRHLPPSNQPPTTVEAPTRCGSDLLAPQLLSQSFRRG